MASKEWKNDIAYAMLPFKLLTWPIGIWPLQVYNVYSLIRFILATCCMSLVMILPTMEFFMGCTNAEQNVDSLMLASCALLGVLKTICFRINAKNLSDSYKSAQKDYLTVENIEYRTVMRRHAFMGRNICCFAVCFSYVNVTVYSLISLLGDDLNDDQNMQINVTNEVVLDYPMPSRCALEYLHVPTSMYRIICIVEFIGLVLTCTCNHGNDSLFLNITLHISGQIKILKANFIDFVDSSPQVYDRFDILIQRHNYLIKLAKEMTALMSFVLITQLFMSSFLLCIMGFEIIFALKTYNVVVMAKSCMVMFTFLIQLLVYSFVGDYFKSQMEEVGLFIYQSAWYDLPTNLAKNVIFIIMRSQSPVKLQAGNFIVVNLATYMSILKTSLSYLSVLRVMVET